MIMLFTRLNEQRFTTEDIKVAIEFLCNPINDCLQKGPQGTVLLRMGHATLMRRMRSLADRFEAWYEEWAAQSRPEEDSPRA